MINLGQYELDAVKKHVKTLDSLNNELDGLYNKIELVCAVTDSKTYDAIYSDIKAFNYVGPSS